MSNIAITSLLGKQPQCLILFVTSWKAIVSIITMAESSNFNCSAESDDDSILSGSMYSTESSNDLSVSDLSVPAVGLRCYCITLSPRSLTASPPAMVAK